jgi:altronate dehydratase large subunit
MSTLQAYRRPGGEVGIRNHLFALPVVVCANQVAIDVARKFPRLKYIEHQHGCAQIGADLTQTRRVFTHLALHPNVYSSIFLGLGCEGVVAKSLFSGAKNQTQKPIDLVVIQEAGGTLGAEAEVQRWIDGKSHETDAQVREPVAWSDIVIGILSDDEGLSRRGELLEYCLEAFMDLGARVVVPARHAGMLARFDKEAPLVDYGGRSGNRVWTMQEGSTALETFTGLTAAGAHLIVHLAARPHAFGSPLAPTVRWSINEQVYSRFYDDFDGQLVDELDVPRLVEQLSRVVSGQLSVAEELGMDDFALYRIGPTV